MFRHVKKKNKNTLPPVVIFGIVLAIVATLGISKYLLTPRPVTAYTSRRAKISLTFPKPMYVTETIKDQGVWQRGDLVISAYPGGNEEISNLTIVYGIPYIDGKGGMCADENGTHWQDQMILSERVSVCDIGLNFHGGYPKHPDGDVEYSFFIGGKNITTQEFQTYKNILYAGLTFSQ